MTQLCCGQPASRTHARSPQKYYYYWPPWLLTAVSMKVSLCLVMLAGTLTMCVAAPNEVTTCVENGQPCKDGGECCGGCCQQNHCVPYSDACVAAKNPCHLYDCVPPKVCYLQQVQCLQSPCIPIPACRAPDSDYD